MGTFKNPIRCIKCNKPIASHKKAYFLDGLSSFFLMDYYDCMPDNPKFLCSECEKSRIELLTKAQNDWLGTIDGITCKYYDEDRGVCTGQKWAPRCSCNGNKALCEK